MALVILYGLLSSAALNLFIVPAAHFRFAHKTITATVWETGIHHGLGVDALGEQEGRSRVAQVVKPRLRGSSTFEVSGEVGQQPAGIDWGSNPGSEDGPPGDPDPPIPRQPSFQLLQVSMRVQLRDGELRETESAPALLRLHIAPQEFPGDALETVTHPQVACFEGKAGG